MDWIVDRILCSIPSKPLRELVDLVGIEPTTSSMPWKRAPSCATGPRLRQKCRSPVNWARGKCCIIFAHIAGIVNARDFSVCFHRHLLP